MILIFFTIISAVVAAALWAEYKQVERRLESLKRITPDLQTEEAAIKAAMVKCNEATGFPATEAGTLDSTKPADALKKWRQEYWSPDHLNKFPFTPNEKGEAKKMPDSDVTKFNEARDNTHYRDTLEQIIDLAVQRTSHAKNRMEQLQIDLKIAQDQAAAIAKVAPEVPKTKEAMKAQLLAQIQKLQEEISKENEQYNARKTLLTEAKAKAEMEVTVETEKYAGDEIKVTNEIRELRRQLEELKVKEIISHEINFVHGKILRPDVPNKSAFIDIGARERVVPGLKFLVGKKGPLGRFDYKAKVEVKKAWMTYSEVAIVEVYDAKERPVVDGDLIVNPLFSKERALVVAFVGEDRPTKGYSVDEAARRILEIGSEVRKDITLDLDYVIFTEAKKDKERISYDPFRKAVFLEIPIAEAKDIYRFLGD
ncbi:MAG TPA: hypothetical protein VF950_26780 [Planctomycetota bacterium]